MGLMTDFSSQKGFSLVELLIAISILAVGILATAAMLSTGIGGDRFAHAVTVETSIASSVIEELGARDGSDAVFSADIAGASYDLDPGTPATTSTVQGRTYSATYSIDASNPVPGVARIDVTVTGGGRAVTMTAFKSTI